MLRLNRKRAEALRIGETTQCITTMVHNDFVRVDVVSHTPEGSQAIPQKIRIGDYLELSGGVKIHLKYVKRGVANYAIDAPRHVVVNREEVHLRVMAERRAAQSPS